MNDDELLKPGDTIAHSNKQLMESPEVEKIAQTVIEREDLDFGPAEIGYFLIYPNLSKYKAAKCIKTSREAQYYSGNNYIIEISGELGDMLIKRRGRWCTSISCCMLFRCIKLRLKSGR